MATSSNGLMLDPSSDLSEDYATLKAIRNLADNATKDLADALKRLSLIAVMAQPDEPPRRKPRLPQPI